ncbi:cytochrome c oxidase assembly protein [Falsiroseomonas sp.]|uniref:cytochrome c oxidase assembly protein n=1 Tax=Falsiroseomonas sp. TaxID=2870721 RepID=UPI00272228EA|nr:cytochrome c oxidase assembly protein [Falsiroseomonas sp.]MDO9503067.1 cytochrome c oxidase assembly protein [Falsiroseomonas sp.]MDP3418607.1 cytochrome c oxidase assembly protein [Falsiroseomonas sp.]
MNPIPFCGPPPLPGGAVWNTHPVLIAVLLLGAAGTLALVRRDGKDAVWPMAGWAMLAMALVSPLCSLSVALFSVRVTQHLVVVLGAAPLLAMAAMRLRSVARGGMAAPAAAFFLLLWLWHAPGPYAATFAADGIAYWMMHVSLAFSATWFWAALLRLAPTRPMAAVVGALTTAIQMGVLGALLTFAPRPLYAVHAPDVTLPWGYTPLEDQQLGGLLMWVPGGLLFVLVLALGLALALRPGTRAAS